MKFSALQHLSFVHVVLSPVYQNSVDLSFVIINGVFL